MSRRGKGYSGQQLTDGLMLIELKKKYPYNPSLTYESIAKQIGVQSHNTIRNWAKLPMDDRSRKQRTMKKAHNKKLTDNEEKIVAGKCT